MITENEVKKHLACDCICHTGSEINEFDPCCRYCGKTFEQIAGMVNETAVGCLNPRGRAVPNRRNIQ